MATASAAQRGAVAWPPDLAGPERPEPRASEQAWVPVEGAADPGW